VTTWRDRLANWKRGRARFSPKLLILLGFVSFHGAVAQTNPSMTSDAVIVQGEVYDSAHHAVSGARVRLQLDGTVLASDAQTNDQGHFSLTAEGAGTYTLIAEKSGLKSPALQFKSSSERARSPFQLTLGTASETTSAFGAPADAMEFADKPNFTVAGVTDWTAVGGHGTDSSVHTSEVLTRETLQLKPTDAAGKALETGDSNTADTERKLRAAIDAVPSCVEVNLELGGFYLRGGRYADALSAFKTAYQIEPSHAGVEYGLTSAYLGTGNFSQAQAHVQKLLTPNATADVHRLAAEVDEKLNDPLTAVYEYEQAVRLDPSEQNYFEWGSELLLHRAVAQAQEVLTKGVQAYPRSSRMLAALGTAFLASALYEQAAQRLCEASDLMPEATEPYLFMGRIDIASPTSLACIEPRLARFVKLQPNNSLANYFYAVALWKRQEQAPDPQTQDQVETLLTKAVTIDSQCGDAYLQLGILNSSQHHLEKAVEYYSTAIRVNPQLSEAHYRLGLAYDRMHQPEKAKREFQLHDEIDKQQADALEQERREIKQFRVVVPDQPAH